MKKIAIVAVALLAVIAAEFSREIYLSHNALSESSGWRKCSPDSEHQYCARDIRNKRWVSFFDVRGNVISYIGGIDGEFPDVVNGALKIHRNARALAISSKGGSGRDAVAVAEILNSNNVGVLAVESCESACALLWSAARIRDMAKTTRIGFHTGYQRYLIPRLVKPVLGLDEESAYREIYRGAGFSEKEIEAISNTPHERMLWFDEKQLKEKLTARSSPGAA